MITIIRAIIYLQMTSMLLTASLAGLGAADRQEPGVPGATMSRTVTLPAKPGPVNIDPDKTAVIVVDMQNDFGARGGMFDRAGIDISEI